MVLLEEQGNLNGSNGLDAAKKRLQTRHRIGQTLVRLRDTLGKHVPCSGNLQLREEDMRRLWHANTKDDLGIPLRSHYSEDCRRININTISAREMAARLPGFQIDFSPGDARVASLVVKAREGCSNGVFRSFFEVSCALTEAKKLLDVHFSSEDVASAIPFLTLGDYLALGPGHNGYSAGLPDFKTDEECAVSYFGGLLSDPNMNEDILVQRWRSRPQ